MRWLLGLHRAVIGGRESRSVGWPLPRPEGPPWQLQLSATAEAERAEALGSLLFMLGMLALCVAGLLLAMRWNVRRALAPLDTLLHAIARIEARDERAARALPPMPVHELEAVARALRHMAGALGAAEDQRRTLGQRIITLQEDERARLGRELHDEFGQHLTALHADAAWLTRHLQTQGTARPEAQEVLAAITSHVRQIQQVLRSVLTRLRPLGLASGRDDDSANDDETFTLQRLQDLLRTLVDSWDRRPNASFRVQLHLDPKDDGHQRLPAAQALAVYRITQEALTNIARHAQARQARVHLQMQADGRLLWSVQDDGVGLPDPAQALLHGSGLGGIHERVWALGADLLLAPAAPGARRPGLLLQASLPPAAAPTHEEKVA
jgi:two-component system sensor histidine kinase UhpB